MPFDLSHGTVINLTAQYIVRVPIAPTYLRVSVLWRYRRRLEPQPIMSDNVLAFVGSHFDHSKEYSGSHLEQKFIEAHHRQYKSKSTVFIRVRVLAKEHTMYEMTHLRFRDVVWSFHAADHNDHRLPETKHQCKPGSTAVMTGQWVGEAHARMAGCNRSCGQSMCVPLD